MAARPAAVPADDQAIILLGMGSNIGDRAANLAAAVRRLAPAITVEAVSSVYESAPSGYAQQPDFLNLVVRAQTALPPASLFAAVKQIEQDMGRRPTVRNGPRIIDIDILAYDERIIATEELSVPHPRMNERAFVLLPLREVAPRFIDARSGESIDALLARLAGQHATRLGPLVLS